MSKVKSYLSDSIWATRVENTMRMILIEEDEKEKAILKDFLSQLLSKSTPNE